MKGGKACTFSGCRVLTHAADGRCEAHRICADCSVLFSGARGAKRCPLCAHARTRKLSRDAQSKHRQRERPAGRKPTARALEVHRMSALRRKVTVIRPVPHPADAEACSKVCLALKNGRCTFDDADLPSIPVEGKWESQRTKQCRTESPE